MIPQAVCLNVLHGIVSKEAAVSCRNGLLRHMCFVQVKTLSTTQIAGQDLSYVGQRFLICSYTPSAISYHGDRLSYRKDKVRNLSTSCTRRNSRQNKWPKDGRGGGGGAGGEMPFIMVGTRSFLILPPILLDCPVNPRFHENTTARTTGDSATWFNVTCRTENHFRRHEANFSPRATA